MPGASISRRRSSCRLWTTARSAGCAGRTAQELLALFVEPQSRKWVAWTPTGYYMASAGGEDLIGWHVNRGWTQEADFFPASRFRAEFNRPDIVQLVLEDPRRSRSDPTGQCDGAAQGCEAGRRRAAAGRDDYFAFKRLPLLRKLRRDRLFAQVAFRATR